MRRIRRESAIAVKDSATREKKKIKQSLIMHLKKMRKRKHKYS